MYSQGRKLVMKTAVVTGGGSGIGRAVADRLRADGYHVATIDLNPSDDEFAHTADVTDRAQVDAALAAIRAQLGPVTVLVNAAGLDGFKRFTDITFDEWQKVVDVNLNGVFHCIQAVLPDMVDTGWGRIVNISSSSTHSGTPYMSHYVAAKSAVNGLTKSLALSTDLQASRSTRCRRASSTRRCCATQKLAAGSATFRRPSMRRRSVAWVNPKTSLPHALS